MALRFWRRINSPDTVSISIQCEEIDRSPDVEQLRINNILAIGRVAASGGYEKESAAIMELADANLRMISEIHDWSYPHVQSGYPVDWLEKHKAADQ
jgi:hypothetical protein